MWMLVFFNFYVWRELYVYIWFNVKNYIEINCMVILNCNIF